jgi:spore germination protein KB
VNDNKKIGVHQFTIIVVIFGIGTSILIAPATLAVDAKQDAWIASVLGMLIGLLPIMIYVALSKKYPHKTIIEINELVFGKWLGKMVSLLYLSYFFILCVLLLGDVGYFLTTEVMPETPIIFFMGCLMIVVIIATRKGIVVIARGAEVYFPWVVLLLTMIVLMLLPNVELQKVEPVLENGLMPVLKGTIPFVSLQEYVVLMMIYPLIRSSKKSAASFYVGSLLAGIVLCIIVLICILVLGSGQTESNLYATFTLAKKISIGNFLERVEVVVGGLWFTTITFKLILTFYAATYGTSQLLQNKSYTYLTIPMGMLVTAMVLPTYTNIVYVMDFIHRVWPAYSLTFMVVLPLLTWFVALARRGKSTAEQA